MGPASAGVAVPGEHAVQEVADETAAAQEDAVLESRCPWAGTSYDGSPEAIGDARRFVVGFLAQLQEERRAEISPQVTGVAQLVVSELVTNACKYAPGPCVVNVELAGPVLEITVWDSHPVLPVSCATEPDRVGGHGLEIVSALCESFEAQRRPVGKQVKARVSVKPAADWSGPDRSFPACGSPGAVEEAVPTARCPE